MDDPPQISPEQRRAAEEHVVARYEAELMKTMTIPADRREGKRRYEPIWPLADGRIRRTEAFQGIFVEEVRIERSYPDTVMVIVFRYFLRPECRFAVPWGIWNLGDLLKPEPHYNDVFVVNLDEWLAIDFKHERYECRGDEIVIVDRVGSWLRGLPKIASGEVRASAEDRELAKRAMEALRLAPTDA